MGYAAIIKLADGTSASADATKKNAPQRKVGPRRRVGGASAGERRDAGSRDAPADASETRRRYPADEVSRCGRWMQRAGGVELFPGGRDEHASPWPSSRGCHARPRSGSCRAEPFWARWIRQDCGPTAYMYTPSGRVDGEAARPERRARLPRPWPHAGRQTHRTASYPNRGRTMSGKPTHTMHGNVKPQSVRSRRRRRRETP